MSGEKCSPTTHAVRVRALAAPAIIMIAVAVRLGLIVQGWPHLNSDEGTLGIMARHIAYGGDRPIFEYGQAYMSALEAYVAALFFRLWGPSLFTLRLGLVIMYALFLLALYPLVTLLYSRAVALVTLALLALGSHDMLFRQLESEGGIQEMLVLLTLTLLLAARLILCPAGATRGRSGVMHLVLGLTAGLALYADPFSLPYLLPCFAALAILAGAALRRHTVWIAAGLIAGLSPALIYNLQPAHRWATLVELWHRFGASGGGQGVHTSLLGHLAGTLLVAFPAHTGGAGVCALDLSHMPAVPHDPSPHVAACTAIHGVWSLDAIALWVLAVALAVAGLRRARNGENRTGVCPVAVHGVRLVLLAGSGLTFVLYLAGAASAAQPWGTQRYLSAVWIALPCLIAPLVDPQCVGLYRLQLFSRSRHVVVGALLLWLLAGTAGAYATGDETADNRWAEWVAGDLQARGLVRFYTDYWTCDRLAFLSQERIACAVLDEQLRPGWDRDAEGAEVVRRTGHAVYLFPGRQPWVGALASGPTRHLFHTWVDGFIVYGRSR